MDASSPGHPSIAGAPMPPPTQAPKQKRKQMHEEKAEFPTNVEITEVHCVSLNSSYFRTEIILGVLCFL